MDKSKWPNCKTTTSSINCQSNVLLRFSIWLFLTPIFVSGLGKRTDRFRVPASGNSQLFSKHYRCISYCHHNHKRPSSQSWQYPERVRRLHLLLHLVFSCKMLPWGRNVLSVFPVLLPYRLHDWSEGCLEIVEWWRAVAFWFSRVLLPWHRRTNIILLEHSTSRAKALIVKAQF